MSRSKTTDTLWSHSNDDNLRLTKKKNVWISILQGILLVLLITILIILITTLF